MNAAAGITSFSPASGPIGTLVTIKSSAAAAVTAVSIGGKSAIIISKTTDSLSAMVMPGAVTGAVTISTSSGLSMIGGNFSVTPTLTPLSPQGPLIVADGRYRDRRGISVVLSADGNTAAASSENGINIYTRSNGAWSTQATGLQPGSIPGPENKLAISADGNTLIATDGYGYLKRTVVATRSNGEWTQQEQVFPIAAGLALTGAVALSADGNTALIGIYDPNNYDNSSIATYVRSNGNWAASGALITNVADAVCHSFALSADGKTAILNDPAGSAARIFSRSGAAWVPGQSLTGTTAYVGQGFALSANGTTAIIAANGRILLFARAGTTWAQQGPEIAAASGDNEYITSVALSADGNLATIGGAEAATARNIGAITFLRRSSGVWTVLASKVADQSQADRLKVPIVVALSADGTTALVGLPYYTTYQSTEGAIQFYAIPPASAAPVTQASNVTFTGTVYAGITGGTVSWTNGSGISRAVFMKRTNTGNGPLAVDGRGYAADTTFGTGAQIGQSGWYCIYDGTGSSTRVSGLTHGLTYRIMTLEYNGDIGYQKYLLTPANNNPVTISAIIQAPSFSGFTPSSGAIGTLVTVSGQHLSELKSITIGGKTAVPVSDGDNSVVAMVMPGTIGGAAAIATKAGGTATIGNFKVTPTFFPSLLQGSLASGVTGTAISADGNTAIAGTTVYTRSSGNWMPQATLPVHGQFITEAGKSVAISADGNTVVMGVPIKETCGKEGCSPSAPLSGHAIIYAQINGNWVQQGSVLTGGSYRYGQQVAISADGKTLIISGGGADYPNYTNDRTYVYTLNNNNWVQQGPVLDVEALSLAISADGNTAIFNGVANTYVYQRNGDTWTRQQGLYDDYSPDHNIGAVALSADGKTAIVANPWYNDSKGVVSMFAFNGVSWVQQATYTTGTPKAQKGLSVALSADGNVAMVGGATVIFYTRPNSAWSTKTKKLSNDPGLASYLALSADGTTAIVNGMYAYVIDQDAIADASLANLTLSSGTLSPVFNSATMAYSTLVPNAITAVQLTPTTPNNDAVIKVNGSKVISGGTSGNLPLVPGINTINTVVTSFDGTTTKTYTIKITRQAAAGSPGVTTLGTSAITVKAATLKGQVNDNGKATTVTFTYNTSPTLTGTVKTVSATTGGTIPAGAGVTATAVNIAGLLAKTTYYYRVSATNSNGENNGAIESFTTLPSAVAGLAAISISTGTLSPAFTTAQKTYAVTVEHAASMADITPVAADKNATLTVNGVPTLSGSSANVSLNVGQNTVNIVVTAQDGSTSAVYTLNVTRSANSTVAPTVPARNLTFSYTTANSTTVSWINGSGTARAVFMLLGSNGSAFPIKEISYAPGTVFKNGTQIGATGWYCIYNGKGSSATVAGLTQGKTYRVTVVEYNGVPGDEVYQTNSLSPASVNTPSIYPTAQARLLTFANTTSNSTTVNWTNGNGTARAAFVFKGANGSALPLDGTSYSANANYAAGTQIGNSGWYCIYNGTASSAPITGLVPNTTYRVTVVEYGTVSGNTLYLTTGLSPASVITALSSANAAWAGAHSVVQKLDNTPAATDDAIVIHQALSPNGDGINDVFRIDGIAAYPDNRVTIINSNGVSVFETKGYDNASKAFDGHSNKTGAMQQAGTYFYTLDYKTGEEIKHKTGFIVLKY